MSSDGATAQMNVTVSVVGRNAVMDELRSLYTWLAGEEVFRGRVQLVEAAPVPGTLGGWPEAVVVALGQDGAVTVLASAVIAWIRHRTSEVKCTLTRSDGTSVEVTATRIRATNVAEIGQLVERVAEALEGVDSKGIQQKRPPE